MIWLGLEGFGEGNNNLVHLKLEATRSAHHELRMFARPLVRG